LKKCALEVSELCLGSMTWGTQNSEAEGHAQIDMALDHGINFIDTAEMYPVNPVSAETVGRTEEIIGSWFARTGRRDEVVLATKVSGDSKAIRGGEGFSGEIVPRTIDASLKRLQTEVIDIYQLHWPMRGSYHFRQNWTFDPSKQNREEILDHMRGVLAARCASSACRTKAPGARRCG
jgi:aryl-alcohol dehydrogenase-like predicted oxidoreductase